MTEHTPKRFTVSCCGEKHEIELTGSSTLDLLNHDIEEEKALRLLGDEPSYCYRWVEALTLNPEDALCIAAHKGYGGMAHLALKLGASPNRYRGFPLRVAAREGFSDAVKLLLTCGAHPDVAENRPLILATINGHLDVVILLIEHGADFNVVKDGAIQLAHQRFHHHVVRYLLSCGIDKEFLPRRVFDDQYSGYNEIHLFYSGVSQKVKDLLL